MLLKERLLKLNTSLLSKIQTSGADRFVRGAHHRRCAREGLTVTMMPEWANGCKPHRRLVASECALVASDLWPSTRLQRGDLFLFALAVLLFELFTGFSPVLFDGAVSDNVADGERSLTTFVGLPLVDD